MRAEHVYGETGFRIAERLVLIAESLSIDGLGLACCAAVGELTGSPTVGLYLFDGDEPTLIYSGHVAKGLLDSYKSGFWKSDPVLNHVLSNGRSGDGASLVGHDNWQTCLTFGALREWGFHYNMGGPLRCGGKIVGVMYTASKDLHSPYTPLHRQHMDLVCRAGSLAITNMIRLGVIESGSEAILPRRPPAPASAQLSPRLADVAVRLCRGQTNKEIARDIGISDQTVKDHVATLCRRFGVHNRTSLAAMLIEGGAA